jgi:D-glycero-D-manno-heptose 1,7-bisphosphate phosphatase
MERILFVDCDGTIREPASGATFINRPDDQRIIEGVAQALTYYQKKGYTIIGTTNQGGVAAGHKQLEDAIAEQEYTLKLLPQIRNIFFCPDFEGQYCWIVGGHEPKPIHLADWGKPWIGQFRKPSAGMIHAANRLLGSEPIDSGHWMIGDREEDKLCAAAAGINFIWADIWRDRFKPGMDEPMDLRSRDVSREQLLSFLAT